MLYARIENADKLVEAKQKYMAESPFIPINVKEYTNYRKINGNKN
jgi:hypothetical protein